MARVQLHLGNSAAALSLAQRADLAWSQLDAESRWAGEAALWLGRSYLALGRRTDGMEALRRAERVLAHSPLPSDVRLRRLAQSS